MNSFYFSSNTPQATAKISSSIMNNYSTLFQSSSSSSTATLPQNSHLSLLNMLMNPHAKNHEPGREDHSLNHVHTSLAETSFEGSSQVMENEGSPDKKKNEKRPRKPRFAFQTRSLVDMLDDGYRWRKYGQKAVKNNKFPRSYFRCTHQGCSVKKQVQRLSKDEGIVVTTYEGMHSHTIQKSTDNFEHILSQMQIYTSY